MINNGFYGLIFNAEWRESSFVHGIEPVISSSAGNVGGVWGEGSSRGTCCDIFISGIPIHSLIKQTYNASYLT